MIASNCAVFHFSSQISEQNPKIEHYFGGFAHNSKLISYLRRPRTRSIISLIIMIHKKLNCLSTMNVQ